MSASLKEQVSFKPVLVGTIPSFDELVCGGMGGSALPALLLKHLYAKKPVTVWRDHGLPPYLPPRALYVAISYSGNTEETLSFANDALGKNMPLCVIASGGALLELAKTSGLPHVVVPQGYEPRDAILATTKALALFAGVPEFAEAKSDFADDPSAKSASAALAKHTLRSIPLFYSSERNGALGYIAKITFNETAKVPAFSNTFPELLHNELQGIDPHGPAGLAKPLSVVLIKDAADGTHMKMHMDLFKEIIEGRGANVLAIDLPDTSDMQKAIWLWRCAREAAHMLAAEYGVPSDEVPLIGEFKRRMQ